MIKKYIQTQGDNHKNDSSKKMKFLTPAKTKGDKAYKNIYPNSSIEVIS